MKPFPWRLALRWALSAALLAVVGLQLAQRWDALRGQHLRFDPLPAAGAALALAGFLAVGAAAWRRLVVGLGGALTYREAFHTLYYPNVAKYLPGSVWSLVGRVVLARRAGVPAGVASAALLLDAICQVVAGVFVGLLALPAFMGGGAAGPQAGPLGGPLGGPAVLAPVAALVVGAVAALHPRVLDAGLGLGEAALRRLGRPRALPRAPYRYGFVLGLLALYVANWALLGLGFALVGQALAAAPLAPARLAFLAGAFAIAWNVGVFALFAPGGLGVRETALVVLLEGAFPAGWPALLALAGRLWIVAGEAAAFALAALLAPRAPAGEPRV